MDISIIAEHEIEVYSTPGTRIKQRVITYQVEGLGLRTIWIDSDKLPDASYAAKYPGKPVPADMVAKGDIVRRSAIEADLAKLKQAAPPRKI